MPRIPDLELERIKREVALVRLCEGYGIELKPQGKDLIGHCPFHQDRTPSFVVSPGKNLWNCLGACGGGGDNIRLVMKRESISFRHAVEKLQTMAGVRPAPAKLKTRLGTEHPVLVNPGTEMADHTLMEHVTDFYHQTFLNHPQAMQYLQKRCCFHPEAVKLFRLGYANRTLGYRVPATTAGGKKLKAQLQRLGVLRASGHEHLNGSIVVPLFDPHGHPAQMYGRKIVPNLRVGTPDHLYLPGELRGVFNGAALVHQKEILLCEAVLDALTLWCAGLRNVTTLYGTNNFTPGLWALLETVRPERVILCFDHDAAGQEAVNRYAPRLAELGAEVRRAKLPPGRDINDVAREQSRQATAALAACIENAAIIAGEKQSAGVARTAPVVETKPPRDREPWEQVPVEIAVPLARELGQELKGVAMELDEDGEHLPCVSNISLQTGQGWCEEPYWPAPYKEVEAQQEQLRQLAGERGLLPAAPAPSSLAAPLSGSEEATKNKNGAAPCAASPETPGGVHGDEHLFTFGERGWRVRGLGKNFSFESMKVQLRAMRGDRFHLDTLDMCNAKHRAGFIAQAAEETGLSTDLLKRDMGTVLLHLETLQEQIIRQAEAPRSREVSLAANEREAALELLRDPRLLERLLADYERCGIVGETTNKLVGYLAAVSRKLDEPLALIIQSTSAAGKSSLMEAVLAFVPPEEKIKYSAMTGQSLYYLGDTDLKHKVLAIVEEEGAEQASYALKLLQSEGELTIASTGKDPATGRMVTQEYRVEGPVMIMLTTTAIDIDEELMNRCIVLTVDESREQTRRIHELQREARTLEGVRRKLDKTAILAAHRNAQRLLRPLRVVNPFARQLTFLDDRTRTRRDHEKYLTLIEAVAFLHQYQRPIKKDGRGLDYIEVTVEDIATTNRLAGEVLGRSLDELPPQTRRLLALITEHVRAECKRLKLEQGDFRFSRRDVRHWIRWSDTALKIHLHRLEEMEYLLVHRSPRGPMFVYEMLYAGEGADGGKFVMGLLDVAKLGYDGDRSGQNGHRSGPGQAVVRGESAPGQPPEIDPIPEGKAGCERDADLAAKNARGGRL